MTQLFPIKDYEERYSITRDGRVWSNYGKGRWLKSRVNTSRYIDVGLHRNGVKVHHSIHRLVAQTFIPNPENKPEVNHKDGIKSNNNDWNLEWATSWENTFHAETNGLTNHLRIAKIKSKYKGVYWNQNVWYSYKRINGIRYYVGRFKDEEDAHKEYLNFNKKTEPVNSSAFLDI